MKKLHRLFSLGAVLLIVSGFLVDVIRAVPTNTRVPTGNGAALVQDGRLVLHLTSTPPPPPQSTPESAERGYMPLVMAQNIVPSVTPTRRPTSTAPPPPEH